MVVASLWPLWLRQLAVHQDFVWFGTLLAWGCASLLWWRRAGHEAGWRWLPWAAAAASLGTLVQFGIFNPHLDIFQSRLRPGTVYDYVPALIDPDLLGDLLLTALTTAWAIVWWLLALPAGNRLGRTLAVLAGLGAAMAAVQFPTWGTAALAGLVFAAAWWQTRADRGAVRLLALLVALLPVVSTVGPVAAALGEMQRAGPPGVAGLLAATAQLLVAATVAAMLLRRPAAPSQLPPEAGAWRWWLAGAVWLVLGLGFAYQVGADNRHEVQQNRLRQTAARAASITPAVVAEWARALPRGWPREVHDGVVILPSDDYAGRTGPLSRVLEREFRSVPFAERARLLVVNGGWLLAVADSRGRIADGTVTILRRATADDERAWQEARNVVETSPVPEIGAPYYCRAAIHATDGRMVGWLEVEMREFFQSLERKWRSGPLLVTALGLLLGATFVLQRRVDREREFALRAAVVEAESNRLKSAFLATVSHELRTPLQSVLGYSELLRARVTQDAQATAWLEAVRQHGELMTRLVNDLIDLGAVEAGTLRLAPRAARPAELLEQIVEGMRPRAAQQGLELKCEIARDLPAAVSLDAERWRQVIFNLVGNAVKFTERGQVSVVLRRGVGERLELAVTDTGPGIAPAEQARLFKPFSRLERTAHKEGAGIGLALCEALCRAMGGALTVVSDGRSGATFTATVALVPAPEETPVAEDGGADLSGHHVLVVDDNRLVRELFTTILTSAGARCSAVGTAAAARRAMSDASVTAVLLDFALPDESGLTLAPQLRALRPRLRIVGASAHAGAVERAAALAAGMDDFVTKPVTAAALLRALGATPPARVSSSPWRGEVERLFRAEAAAAGAAVEAALQTGEAARTRAAAHYLANSAAAVGDLALCDRCEAVVRAAEQGDLRAAEAAWSHAREALKRWIQARG